MKSFSVEISELNEEERILFAQSTDDSFIDDLSVTPLVAAIHCDDLDLVKTMLDVGHSVTATTFLSSPIGAALSSTKENSNQILKVLLDQVGSLTEENPMDYCGELNEPMLHHVTRRADLDKIKMLLEYGSNPSWYDTDYHNCWDVAEENDSKEIIDLFKSSGFKQKK